MTKNVKLRNNALSQMTAEYRSFVEEAGVSATHDISDLERLKLLAKLVTDGQWTPSGAQELMYIATRYGHFFLRNAYALAQALEIEDGLIEM